MPNVGLLGVKLYRPSTIERLRYLEELRTLRAALPYDSPYTELVDRQILWYEKPDLVRWFN